MKYAIVLVACLTILACAEDRGSGVETPGTIRVAVLPDQSKETLLSQYSPLLEYLRTATSLEFELIIPSDYADLLDQFDAGHIDLAWFGGLTYIQAEERSDAVPLAFRDVDLRFTSCYLARTHDPRTTLREFEGEDFSFGPELSTSGHLMPRYFMTDEGLSPEQIFASTRHSTGHDQTAQWVSDGTVVVGVANCVIVQALFDNGSLSNEAVRVFETTPPYSNYVWAVNSSMDARLRMLLLDAFLALDATNPEHRMILRLQAANAYLPAGRDNFSLVHMAAERANLLEDDSE